MNRIFICAVLMISAVCLCVYSQNKSVTLEKEIVSRLGEFETPLNDKDTEALIALAVDFERFWDEHESVMIHLVRHSNLDVITTAAARMPHLARHGEFGELAAEISNIKRQMEHIRDNESVNLGSVF